MGTQLVNFGPNLEQRLRRPSQLDYQIIRRVMQTLRVCLVGIIQDFDPGPPATVSVQVATRELVMANQAGGSGASVSETIDFGSGPQDLGGTQSGGIPSDISLGTNALALPLLTDVPLIWPQGGGWNLTCPVQAGDECVVFFSDTSLDGWLQSGADSGPVNQVSQRRHSLSDGLCFVGVRSTPNGLDNYSTSSMQLRSDDGTVLIDLADGQITITVTDSSANVTINAGQDVTVNAGRDANVIATRDASVRASNNATVHADQGAAVEGDTVNITGSSQVTIGDHVTIDGKLFLSHTHSGVQSGGSTTGPVV